MKVERCRWIFLPSLAAEGVGGGQHLTCGEVSCYPPAAVGSSALDIFLEIQGKPSTVAFPAGVLLLYDCSSRSYRGYKSTPAGKATVLGFPSSQISVLNKNKNIYFVVDLDPSGGHVKRWPPGYGSESINS